MSFILVADNGSTCTSNRFKLFTAKDGIKHILTACYRHSFNGPAERAM